MTPFQAMRLKASAGGGGGGDPYFANVIALLHFDSATTTDITGRTWSDVGSPTISSAQSVFGGASMLTGASDYIETADHADWEFGSGEMTMEGRTRFSTASGNDTVLGKVDASGYTPWLLLRQATNLNFFASSNGLAFDIANGALGFPVVADTWYAWRIARDAGGDIHIYVGGTEQATVVAGGASFWNNAAPVQLGSYNGTFGHDGYTDEFRVTKAVCRSSGSSYTLDVSAFPDF